MTPRQAELLGFIVDYQHGHGGASPSYDEMRAAMGVGSKASIHRWMAGLEQRGVIARRPEQYRSIRVLAVPGAATLADLDRLVHRLVRQEGAARVAGALEELMARMRGVGDG